MDLQKIQSHLEAKAVKINEYTIASQISELIGDTTPSFEMKAEHLAFMFCETQGNTDSTWGTYYGPIASWLREDGSTTENPSLDSVDSHTLAYWASRSAETENPILKARYSGLVWDLSKAAADIQPDYQIAVVHIEAILDICKGELYEHSVEGVQKIKRAYRVAKGLNNTALIDKCIETMIELEDHIAQDEKPGLWGFSFDVLVLGKEPRLSDEQSSNLLDEMENRLARLVEAGNPWPCESAGMPLATYYRGQHRHDDTTRIGQVLGGIFESSCEGKAPLLATSLYQHAHDIYISFNLKSEAEKVSSKILEIGPAVIESMSEITTSTQISQEQLDAYLEDMTEGGVEKSISRIACQLTARKGELEELVIQLAKDNPLSYLFKKTLQDHSGRPVAEIGGIEDDLEGNVLHQMAQSLSINSFFLRHSLERLVTRYEVTPGALVEIFLQSPVFTPARKNLVLAGIEAHFREDYIASIHILIPQLEAAFRTLLELTGAPVLKKNRQGGLQLRTLDELLRDNTISNCFGEDAAFYFRGVLTDQRAWNIRNDVCHGLSPQDQFGVVVSDRILHVMMYLSQVRQSESG
ncbi:hypothetical protein A3709_16730 [Halioglobus sp. HI00S01]|uniref:DUF4209 domain-containing protein n=1 Tax=Halioglobus sp. HI00S01 TaxID=1822214 RepID=UPI0007C1FDA0|nr:DUF4209 domain-containing protein [Halioglobus sp. HI00S01]KZX59187.1 hypothetical protein A3709_16730 [Halioglobus sp. HI00S01]